MYKLISSSQSGAMGPMDVLFDTTAEDVLIAFDLRDYRGTISPQYSSAAVVLIYPDDVAWLFGGLERPEYYGYTKSFKTYQDYCTWINQNTL